RGDRLQRLVRAGEVVPGLVRDRPRPVWPLAVHGEVHQAGQLPGEVLHVHARPAVDLWRVLPGQQGHVEPARRAGEGHGGTSWPLPTTVMPPADTVKPRARSRSLSTPT